MCYSALVWASYHKYQRVFGGELDIKEFLRLYETRAEDRKVKIPKGVDLAFLDAKTPEERRIKECIDAYNAETMATSEPELFKQVKRLADAERASDQGNEKGAERPAHRWQQDQAAQALDCGCQAH